MVPSPTGVIETIGVHSERSLGKPARDRTTTSWGSPQRRSWEASELHQAGAEINDEEEASASSETCPVNHARESAMTG